MIVALRRSFAKMALIQSHFDQLNIQHTWRQWPGVA